MAKLREINKRPLPPVLSDNLIVALTDLCFFSATLSSADALFVFGSHILHQEIADLIQQVVTEHAIPTVILTGGIADYQGTDYVPQPESSLIFEQLNHGVFPNTNFIRESRSKNTLENVQQALPLFDFTNVNQLLFISHAYAARRAALTLKRYLPQVILGNYPINIPTENPKFSLSKSDWYKTADGRATVWGEYLRLKTYGERGDFSIADFRDRISVVEQLKAR